jgi:hypothetical protein
MNNVAIANHSRKIIVVLGAGRSGTSMAMQVLSRMGMRLSEELLPGQESNPEGFYEDIEILNVHKNLIAKLKTSPNLPLPDSWQETEEARDALKKMRAIIKDRLAVAPTLWGFKDPRTALFLPIWVKAFDDLWVTPIYVLVVRDPKAVVNSQKKITNRDGSIFEMMWLSRNCEALHHTRMNCFILHYEKLLSNPEKITKELLAYTGLNPNISATDIEKMLQQTIKSNLNRSGFNAYEIQNNYLKKLYNILLTCHGTTFDKNALMDTVTECRKAMMSFHGWILESRRLMQTDHDSAKHIDRLKKDIEKLSSQNNSYRKEIKGFIDDIEKLSSQNNSYRKEIRDLTNDMENVVLQNNSYLREIKDLTDEITQLNISLKIQKDDLKKISDNLKWAQKEKQILRESTSYKIGNLIVMALKKPGKNSFLLPFRFFNLFIAHLFKKTPK